MFNKFPFRPSWQCASSLCRPRVDRRKVDFREFHAISRLAVFPISVWTTPNEFYLALALVARRFAHVKYARPSISLPLYSWFEWYRGNAEFWIVNLTRMHVTCSLPKQLIKFSNQRLCACVSLMTREGCIAQYAWVKICNRTYILYVRHKLLINKLDNKNV